MKHWVNVLKGIWFMFCSMAIINSLGKIALDPDLMTWPEIFVPFIIATIVVLIFIPMAEDAAREEDNSYYEYY